MPSRFHSLLFALVFFLTGMVPPRPGVDPGTVVPLRIVSPLLQDTVETTVYLPPGAQANRRLPVVYAIYTEPYFTARTVRFAEWLDSAMTHGVPPMIVVGVPTPATLDAVRPDTDAGRHYRRFLLEELLPAVESHHPVCAVREGRGLLGFSAGGNTAVDVAVRAPGRFAAVAAQSPGWMLWSQESRTIGAEFTRPAVDAVVAAGSLATLPFWFAWGDADEEWEARSRRNGQAIIAALRSTGAPVDIGTPIAGGHGLHQIPASLPEALTFLGRHLTPCPAGDAAAGRIVERALTRMDGTVRLADIRRLRYDMLTQWQRTHFSEHPYADRPSYEQHTDVRDYDLDAWRNSRRFGWGAGARLVIDLVRDSVGWRTMPEGARPLPMAYVDERDELFFYSPDRVMLAIREAADLHAGPDTTLGGVRHVRVSGSYRGVPFALFLTASDTLPAMLRFRKAHTNDFGLAQWGTMDVEVWYSGWRPFPGGVNLPSQWDIRRVGRPYKRLTILSAAFNPPFAADSFAVTDSMRAAFERAGRGPMHDLPLDSARVLDDRMVAFRTFGAPLGAVRIGTEWLLLEAGRAPLSYQRSSRWLQQHTGGRIAMILTGLVSPDNGGVAAEEAATARIVAAPGTAPILRAALQGYGRPARAIETVDREGWLAIGGDSVFVQPFDLPDAAGTFLVWAPSLRWLYAPQAATPLGERIVLDYARARGWMVERLGSARDPFAVRSAGQ